MNHSTNHSTNHSKTLFAFVSSTLLLASPALAEKKEPHTDLWVTASNGALVTGGWDHLTGEVINPSQRVFEAEFGIDPAFPFSTDEPGIGSDLVGTTLTMNLLSGLSRWNGAGFDASSSWLFASYGGQDATTNAGGSFSFAVTAGLDLHPEYTLFGAGGADPVNGIYLASFTVSASGLATSEVFYAVFNLGMAEADHAAAAGWVEANLVPAPGAIALVGVSGLVARRRRR
jgi:hypothetical protein